MSDRLDDLERLGRLRDEGRISEDEYESLKEALLQGTEPDSVPTSPAGWYPDPNGVVNRQVYWDGEQWTAHIHDAPVQRAPLPNQPQRPARLNNGRGYLGEPSCAVICPVG